MTENRNEQWSEVDDYISSTLIEPDAALEETLRISDEQGLPNINVAPNQGKFLSLLAQMHGARSILEIGTLAGYSTIWLARALPDDGLLVTIEGNDHHAQLAARNIENAGLKNKVDVYPGDAQAVLASLIEQGAGPFDFIFIDADKPAYPRYLDLALELARPGSVIVGDNVVRRGELSNPRSEDPRVQGVRTFLDMLRDNDRLDATALQTVGTKGYDGFALALVTR